jgi:predicted RNA-binding protein with PIN domain
VRWLVDGMNVIGSRPDGWWRDRDGAVRDLVEGLDALAAGDEPQVVAVFDGRPVDGLKARRVDIRFAPRSGRNAADDEIVRLVEGDPDPASLRVVTSDAALAERVRALGAEVEGAGGFRRRLDALRE